MLRHTGNRDVRTQNKCTLVGYPKHTQFGKVKLFKNKLLKIELRLQLTLFVQDSSRAMKQILAIKDLKP